LLGGLLAHTLGYCREWRSWAKINLTRQQTSHLPTSEGCHTTILALREAVLRSHIPVVG
jgi:hypothetical protein